MLTDPTALADFDPLLDDEKRTIRQTGRSSSWDFCAVRAISRCVRLHSKCSRRTSRMLSMVNLMFAIRHPDKIVEVPLLTCVAVTAPCCSLSRGIRVHFETHQESLPPPTLGGVK
jgi:hypothetical protein